MPPDVVGNAVPDKVIANVPLVVIGEPEIDKKEGTLADTLVTVPKLPVSATPLADKTPVEGTKDSLVELVVAGLLPVDAADRIGYQVELELVLSVIATLVALVAVVAVVAVDALPVKAPTKVVDVTLVSPAIVVAVPPRLIAVEPTVIDELLRAELGMLVKDAPEPLKTVAVSVPVEGLN